MFSPMTLPDPKILVIPKPSLYRQLFAADSDAALRQLGRVTFNTEERDWTSGELAERIGEFDVVVTSWRSPKFTEEVLSAAKKLKLIAHSAGSIRFMLSEEVLENGFQVTTVAAAMAHSVAEFSLMLPMMLLRPIHRYDCDRKKAAEWLPVKLAGTGQEIAGQCVGVIGAGHTGRAFIRLLNAVGAHVWVFDPYLTDAQATELQVKRIETLDELLSNCNIVSLQ